MDPLIVVVVYLGVDLLNELACRIEAFDLSKLILEVTKERFLVAVLPRRGFG